MEIYTFIDITETKKHRNNSTDAKAIDQQANYMTFVQTLTLRTNIIVDSISIEEISSSMSKKLGFGSDYKEKNRVWRATCSIDEGHTFPTLSDIEKDFNLVPVLNNLDETILINNNVFKTRGNTKNIIIKI